MYTTKILYVHTFSCLPAHHPQNLEAFHWKIPWPCLLLSVPFRSTEKQKHHDLIKNSNKVCFSFLFSFYDHNLTFLWSVLHWYFIRTTPEFIWNQAKTYIFRGLYPLPLCMSAFKWQCLQLLKWTKPNVKTPLLFI